MGLPNEIGYLKNLTHLVLCKNKLNELPEDIGNLSNLIVLNLQVRTDNVIKYVTNMGLIFSGQLFIRSSSLTGQSEEIKSTQYSTEFVHCIACVRVQIKRIIATLSKEKLAHDIVCWSWELDQLERPVIEWVSSNGS